MVLEQVKRILEENNIKDEKKDTKFDYHLMENKIEFDKYLLEILILSYGKDSILNDDKKLLEIENIVNDIFKNITEIYESLDLFPYVFGRHVLNENDLITEYKLISKLVDVLNEEISSVYKIAVNNTDEEKFEKTKYILKEFLNREKDIDKAVEYTEKFTLLSELVDRILFAGLNYKVLQHKDEYLNEDIIDKDMFNKMFTDYENLKESLLKTLL